MKWRVLPVISKGKTEYEVSRIVHSSNLPYTYHSVYTVYPYRSIAVAVAVNLNKGGAK